MSGSGRGCGGRGGIRTPEGLAPPTVFKTAAFDRSATRPAACDTPSRDREQFVAGLGQALRRAGGRPPRATREPWRFRQGRTRHRLPPASRAEADLATQYSDRVIEGMQALYGEGFLSPGRTRRDGGVPRRGRSRGSPCARHGLRPRRSLAHAGGRVRRRPRHRRRHRGGPRRAGPRRRRGQGAFRPDRLPGGRARAVPVRRRGFRRGFHQGCRLPHRGQARGSSPRRRGS